MMNPHLKFKATLVGFGSLKLIQMILQLCLLLFSISVQIRFKYVFEVNLVFLILFLLSVMLDSISYKSNHSFLYGEVIFSVIALMGYIPFSIFLSVIKPINIPEKRFASVDLQVAEDSNEQPSIDMSPKLTNTNNDLFYKIILPMILILMFQITNFILSLIIIDTKESIERNNVLNVSRYNSPTTVHVNHSTIVNGNTNSEVGNSYINNEILTNINRNETKIEDPPPAYDEVVSRVPETIISFTPPPTYNEAKKMNKNKDSSFTEEDAETNNLT